MKAIWNNVVLAEAPQEKLIHIEGNWYFPPESLSREYFGESPTRTICFWKGEASYYHVIVGNQFNSDAAWYYPVPMAGSVERVGRDYTSYVAFWRGVEVRE